MCRAGARGDCQALHAEAADVPVPEYHVLRHLSVVRRCADMPVSHLNRRCYSHIVGIIPGPQEPRNLDPYLEPLLEEFRRYRPGPKGELGCDCDLGNGQHWEPLWCFAMQL